MSVRSRNVPPLLDGGARFLPSAFHRLGADNYYPSGVMLGNTLTTGALGINSAFTCPLIIARRGARIDRLKVDVTVAAGAGGVAKFGIYDSDPVTLYPRALVLESAQFANDIAAAARVAVVDFVPITGALYWAFLCCGVSGCTVRAWGLNTGYMPLLGSNEASNGNHCVAWQLGSFGGYPVPFPAAFPGGAARQPLSSGVHPYIGLRFSA